ncbi:MAG: tetratricopeptide repeat protein [Betaproteobacteria bacterium]|nr:tetratricopeptide repeat protein [Betaproteobacteria bacterium]
MKDKLRRDLLCLAAIAVAVLAVYLPGLGNPLVFDDAYLVDKLKDEHGTLRLQVRMLSYGSFLWLMDLFGQGWWKQRLLNIVLHLGTVAALAGLYREILRAIEPAPAPAGQDPASRVSYGESPAFWVAIGVFALNPVATYAVAYLIQRSILMATLFVALALWLFARGLRLRNPLLFGAALVAYLCALASKEHAILAPLAAVPLYILIARPSAARLLSLAGAGAALVGIAGYALLKWYGNILGKPFDETSEVYLDQLAQLNPEAKLHAYPLSILNQAYLFFQYGLRWLIPVTDWMSIQMRPPFPVTWLTFPQALGIVAYASTIVGGFFLVIRYRDWRALAGVSVLLPALLFPTEFGLIWVQDPFVLYRSYLWAIGVPGLAFVLLHGPSARTLGIVAVALAGFLCFQTLDRVMSFSSPERVYTDAIAKLPDDPRAVGRWFPYLNRGNIHFEKERFDLAIRDFQSSAALGDRGLGTYNTGSILLIQGKPQEALRAFDDAERQGYRLPNLYFQRGMALVNLGRPAEAVPQFENALRIDPQSDDSEGIYLYLGRAKLQLGKPVEAAQALERVLAINAGNAEARYVLGMSQVAQGDFSRALGTLNPLFAQRPPPSAYYARALAYHGLKRKAEAIADIDTAIRLGLDNPNTRQWQAKIRAMP